MKKLLSYLIIIFFSSLTFSFSEGISDFEIEGISVGQSVYNYFTEETLNKTAKTKKRSYNDGYGSSTSNESINLSGVSSSEVNIPVNNLEIYDDVKVSYFAGTSGSDFITDVTGIKYFEKNNCEGKQKEAVNGVKKILQGDYKLDEKINTNLKQFTFFLENGGSIMVACYQKDKTTNDVDWISALLLKIDIIGQDIALNFNPSVSNEAETGSDFIQIRPIQTDIEDRIKF
jgi:hypothetical protein